MARRRDRFPISQTITGVVLDLEPGGLRELHWHPTADEWQYVVDGQVSVTLFGSHGRYRAETLDTGRRRLHPARLRPLDREHRPEGGAHPDRLQHRPLPGDRPVAMDRRQPDVLAGGEFQQAGSIFEKFPKERVFIAPTGTMRYGDREIK